LRLRVKAPLIFLVLALLPAAIIAVISFRAGQRTIELNVMEHLASTTLLKQDELERWINDISRQLEFLARSQLSEDTAQLILLGPEVLNGNAASNHLIDEYLDPSIQVRGGFLTISILAASDGRILVSTDPDLEGKYRESEPFFLEGLASTYVQNVSFSQTLERAVMHISTPLTDSTGDVFAVLVGHPDFAEISKIMRQGFSLDTSEDTYLVNAFNFFVTEPRYGEGYALQKAVRTAGVDAALAGETGAATYEDYRGALVIGAYQWIPELELAILTEVDQAEAFAPIVQLRNTIFAFAAGVALLALLLGVFVSRTVTRPVLQLVRSTEIVGQGNLDHRTGIKIRDEIGQLASAFDQMAADLQETTASRDELNQEITAHLQSLEKLRRRDEQLGAAQRIARLGSWEWDIAHNKTLWSDEMYRIYGVSPEQFDVDAYEGFMSFIHPDDRQLVAHTMETALSNKEPFRIEYRIVRPDGVVRNIAASGEVVCDESGEPISMLGASQDVTERKRAEAERLFVEEQLRQGQKLESIGTLASGVAHEVNNPLMAMINYAELLKDEPEGDEIAQYADGIIKEGNRVATIVRNLLSFSRQDTEAHSPADIKDIIDASLSLTGAVLRKDQITVELYVPDDLPKVKCRSQQIQQVVINLLTNAHDALNERYPDFDEDKILSITVLPLEKDGATWVRTTVEDRGPGIPEHLLGRIFDPFFTTKPRDIGTGLGLSVSYGIVTEHHGELTVESEEGSYTRFHVDLLVNNGWTVMDREATG